LSFEDINNTDFNNLTIFIDSTDNQKFQYNKYYDSQTIEFIFSHERTNIPKIIITLNDSSYHDTIFNIKTKLIKESVKCGDFNQVGVTFTHKKQDYDFKSSHELNIKK